MAMAPLPIEVVQEGTPLPIAPATDHPFIGDVFRVSLKAAPFVLRVPKRIAANLQSPNNPRGGIAVNIGTLDGAFRSKIVGALLSELAGALGCDAARFGRPSELWVSDKAAGDDLLPGSNYLGAHHASETNGDALDYHVEKLLGVPSGRNLLSPGQTLYASIIGSTTFHDCYRIAEEVGAGDPPTGDRRLESNDVRLIIMSFTS